MTLKGLKKLIKKPHIFLKDYVAKTKSKDEQKELLYKLIKLNLPFDKFYFFLSKEVAKEKKNTVLEKELLEKAYAISKKEQYLYKIANIYRAKQQYWQAEETYAKLIASSKSVPLQWQKEYVSVLEKMRRFESSEDIDLSIDDTKSENLENSELFPTDNIESIKNILENKSEIMLNKIEESSKGNLYFKIIAYDNVVDKNSKLLFESRKTALSEDKHFFLIEHSSCEKKEDLLFFSFFVSLEMLSFDTQTVINSWDVYLSLGETKYRIKSFDKLEMTFKSVYHDLIPYSTIYKNFSIMSIRKKSRCNIIKYKKSITFILVRIDYRGGVTKVTIDLANSLANNGYKVTIVAINTTNTPNNYAISENVSFDYVSLNMHTDKNIIFSNAYNKREVMHIEFIKKIHNYFSNLDTDFVYFPIYGSAMFINLLNSIPISVKKIIGDHSGRRYEVFDKLLQENKKVSLRELRNLTTDYHYLDNLEKIDAIHVVNPLVKSIYEQITTKPILGIPNIVRTEPLLMRKSLELNWKKRKKVIIAVGSLVKIKNFETLIRVFHEISMEFQDWVLEIYGDGSEKENLQKLIVELSLINKVYLKGFNSNIIEKFQNSMLHISVSHIESFGLTMVESMSQGCLVLSTSTTIGAKYLIENKTTGFLSTSNNQEDIILKLKEVISLIDNNDALIFKIQENAYRKSQYFNSDSIVKEWDKVLLN